MLLGSALLFVYLCFNIVYYQADQTLRGKYYVS